MKREEAIQIVEIIDEVIRGRRGAALFPGGVATNLGNVWVEKVLEIDDAEIATQAAVALFSADTHEIPNPADFRRAVTAERERRRAAVPVLPEAEPVREYPLWVKAYKVARARGDMRVWPEQEIGYNELQLVNPSARTYVWSEQDVMPEADRKRYEEVASKLTVEQIEKIGPAL